MKITLEVADTLVSKVRGQDFTANIAKMPEASLLYIFEYGVQRVFNDAASGAQKMAGGENAKDEKIAECALTLAIKKHDALLAGQIRVSSARETDPVKVRVIELMTPKVIKAIVAKGGKPKNWTTKQIRDVCLAKVTPEVQAQAEKDVAAARALDFEVDLD